MKKLSLLFTIGFLLLGTTNSYAQYEKSESFALQLDKEDYLSSFRDQFHIPKQADGSSQIYFCGHSLGLQPVEAKNLMLDEMTAWANLGVDGHFKENAPWYTYHELVRESLARLVGAYPKEVVAMNSLTVNLHLMLTSFYQPTEKRYKIIMESPVFSSDTYAVKSHIDLHGYQDKDSLIVLTPREGEEILRLEDIEEILDTQGEEIALVLFSAVNYFNGQVLDLKKITKKAHEKGCLVGFDLAHAAGNIPLQLHEDEVDFAVWCSYKYLNSGPGAIGGAFVHEKHLDNIELKRLAGWWGNDPKTRFQLHLQPDFIPIATADGWQISNPSIFSLVPLRASLNIYDKAGILNIREKALKLTGYLEFLINEIDSNKISIITPQDPSDRGSMLSIRVDHEPEALMQLLASQGVICDFRKPNVLRITPAPLYNTFHEVFLFSEILRNHLEIQ